MTDQERVSGAGAAVGQGERAAEQVTKDLGKKRMPDDDIPPHLHEIASRKLGVEEVALKPARDGGAYKGKVLHSDSNFVVQGVGTKGNSAVVHRASELEFVSSNLKWCQDHNRLGSRDVQVHYGADGRGKVYPYDAERVAAPPAQRPSPSSDQRSVENKQSPEARNDPSGNAQVLANMKKTAAELRKPASSNEEVLAAMKETTAKTRGQASPNQQVLAEMKKATSGPKAKPGDDVAKPPKAVRTKTRATHDPSSQER